MVATWGFIFDQKEHSHFVSRCYTKLLRAEYIEKLEKMAIVPRLLKTSWAFVETNIKSKMENWTIKAI